jgi:hypothetical protein
VTKWQKGLVSDAIGDVNRSNAAMIGARDLPPLHAGQPVYYQHQEGHRWKRGAVQQSLDNRSYVIHGDNSGVYRRNRVHIRPTCPPVEVDSELPMTTVNDGETKSAIAVKDFVLDLPVVLSPRPQRVRQ